MTNKTKIKKYDKLRLVAIIIATGAGFATFTENALRSIEFGAILIRLIPILSGLIGGILGYYSEKSNENK